LNFISYTSNYLRRLASTGLVSPRLVSSPAEMTMLNLIVVGDDTNHGDLFAHYPFFK